MTILSNEELEQLAEGIMLQYMGENAAAARCVNIDDFAAQFLNLTVLYRRFAEQDMDKIGFISDGATPLHVYECKRKTPVVYDKDTIVMEECLRQPAENNRRRFTLSHECAHFLLDRASGWHRAFDKERLYSKSDLAKLFSFREAQADRLAAALLMPFFLVHNVAKHICLSLPVSVYGSSIVLPEDKLKIKQMSDTMCVSYTACFIRLKECRMFRFLPISQYLSREMGLELEGCSQ